MLEYLIRNQGVVLSREKIAGHIWNYSYEGGSNVVDVYIRYLRKKIDEGQPRAAHPYRSRGRLCAEGGNMKRAFPSKARVTLWFTLFLTLLAGLALGTLLAVGGQLTEQGSQNTLKKAVSEGLEELDWEDGRRDIDDDLKSYQDGVWLAVYDQTGSLVYGGLPDDLGLDQPFEEGALRTCRQGQEVWYLYDLVSRGQEGTLWLRGATAAQSANQTFPDAPAAGPGGSALFGAGLVRWGAMPLQTMPLGRCAGSPGRPSRSATGRI